MAESINFTTIPEQNDLARFNRIVRFETPDGRIYEVPVAAERVGGWVSKKTGIQEREVLVGNEHPDRLVSFIDRFMKGQQRYDCHTFAFTMLGEDVDHVTAPERARSLVARGERYTDPGYLKLGQIGTVGGLNLIKNREPFPDHSIFGLGQDIDLCLEVDVENGTLGLNPYQAIYPRFTDGIGNMLRLANVEAYQLYIEAK